MHKFKKIGIALSSLLPCMASLGVTACSELPAQEEIVEAPKNIKTSLYKFSIPVSFKLQPTSYVNIQIKNEDTNKIIMLDPGMIVTDKKGEIQLGISPDIIEDTMFNFDLTFAFACEDGKVYQTTLYGFYVYFTPKHEDDFDEIRALTPSVIQTNKHDYVYTLQFQAQSITPINITLIETSGKLTMPQRIYQMERIGGKYIVTIPIYLNLGVANTTQYHFDLELNFLNSKHIQQKSTIQNLVLGFNWVQNETVLPQYLDIREENDETVLYGLKEDTPAQLAGKFSTLEIPSNVTTIAESAFYPQSGSRFYGWFSGIHTIKFNEFATKVGSWAFAGCNNLYIVDCTEFDNNLPSWLTEPQPNPIFATDSSHQLTQPGYVWAIDEDESIKLTSLGLTLDWEILDKKNSTVPMDAYEIKDGVLIGMNDKYGEGLSKYQIIEIPQEVVQINDYALAKLLRYPYKDEKTTKTYATRRIILHNKIQKIGKLTNTGISGSILWFPKMSVIEKNCLQDICYYPSYIADSKDVYMKEPRLTFINTNELTEIQDSAFVDIPVIKDLTLPHNIRKIGDRTFKGQIAETLRIPPSLQDVGHEAFANLSTIVGDKTKYVYLGSPEQRYTTIPAWLDEDNLDMFLYSINQNTQVYIYIKSGSAAADETHWKDALSQKHHFNINLISVNIS